MSREVVITGVGAVTPLGVGARTLHERWSAGVVGIADGKGVATEFEPTDHLTVKEVRRADRFTQFALVAGDEALLEAGWGEELPYEGDRIATILGTGIGGIGTLERGKEILLESGPKKVPPLSVPLMMSNGFHCWSTGTSRSSSRGATSVRNRVHQVSSASGERNVIITFSTPATY